MAPSSTLSSKGQVTIPIEVRQRLGLSSGDRVEFVFEEGRTVLRPASHAASPFAAWIGALPAFQSKQEIQSWLRELRGPDPEEPAHEAGA